MANIKPLGQRVLVKRLEADAISAGGIVLPDTAKEKPQEAEVLSLGTGGKDDKGVLIEFTVAADGSIKDIEVKSSTDRVFNNASINAVRQFKCNAQGRDVRVSVPFVFKLVN